ncbi:MAG: hypothetical protein DBY35_09940 [Bacteroidales bacterium]|nr:MAG: hypothetical protein DBY35_09940 [Bacteroidales bacterium]
MKKLLLTLMLAIIASTTAFAFVDSYTIKREQLPEEAQQMLEKYFPKAKIGMIKIDRHLLKKTDYDVRLVNGTTIEFNNSGKWTSVDCKSREVPEGLVTKTIRNYIQKNYADVKIVKVKKKSSGYEIGLSDGVDLKFNLLGQFKGVKMEE